MSDEKTQPAPAIPLDVLETALGQVPALATRLVISGLTALAASREFGWLGSVNTTSAILIQAGVTAGLHAAAEWARTKWPKLGWLPW